MIGKRMDEDDELGEKIISNIDRQFKVDPKMWVERSVFIYTRFC